MRGRGSGASLRPAESLPNGEVRGRNVYLLAAALSMGCAKQRPERIVVSETDTLVVNSTTAVQLPARLLDASGRELDAGSVLFEPVSRGFRVAHRGRPARDVSFSRKRSARRLS